MFLTETEARALLKARGYELILRFGHIHAFNEKELHICLLNDLSSLSPAQFLQCLDDAINIEKRAHTMLNKTSNGTSLTF